MAAQHRQAPRLLLRLLQRPHRQFGHQFFFAQMCGDAAQLQRQKITGRLRLLPRLPLVLVILRRRHA